MQKKTTLGHILAIISMLIWGTTFVSTKVVLQAAGPLEVLFFRMLIGVTILFIVYPKRMKVTDKKHNYWMIAAAATGVFVYQIVENYSLELSPAGHVSLIVALAPCLTYFLAYFTEKDIKFSKYFFIGFALAISGITFISLSSMDGSFSLLGAFLAFLAALCWAGYSLTMKRVLSFGYSEIAITRRLFIYTIIALLPFIIIKHHNVDFELLFQPSVFGHMFFLGAFASALAFIIWNIAIKNLGPV